MESNGHEELTAAERRALDELPREGYPGRLLEERTVRALRERGLLRSPRGAVLRTARFWRAAAGIAAAIALFASGIVVGQRLDAAASAQAPMLADGQEPALDVQRTGSEYVAALTRLVDTADAAAPADMTEAREVALAALWAAAGEVVRLAPDDPIASQILRGFERARQDPTSGGDGRPPVRQVIWF